jgi:hypothetical protein
MQSQKPFYFSTFEARWKATSPTGKVRLSFSRTNLFKFARRAWSLCADTCRVITSCNLWFAEAEFRLCSRTSKRLAWGSLLTVLTTKIQPSKPRVREKYMTSFMHVFSTNKVQRVVLWFSWVGTHFGKNWNQHATRARHGRTTRCGHPGRCGHTCPVARAWSNAPPLHRHNLDDRDRPRKRQFDRMDEVRITWINGSTCPADQPPQLSFPGNPRHPWAKAVHHTARSMGDRTSQPSYWAKPTQGTDPQPPQEQWTGASKARGGGSQGRPHPLIWPHLWYWAHALNRPPLPIKGTSHSLEYTHNAGASHFLSFVHLE